MACDSLPDTSNRIPIADLLHNVVPTLRATRPVLCARSKQGETRRTHCLNGPAYEPRCCAQPLAATKRPNFCAGVEVVGPLVIN
jgi:hypothetical protein